MELLISTIFILFALYLSFLSGVMHSLSQDSIQEISEKKPDFSGRIQYVWDCFDRIYDSIKVFKLVLLLSAFSVLAIISLNNELQVWQKIANIIVPVYLLIIFDTLIYTFGKKIGNNTLTTHIPLILFFTYLASPFYETKQFVSRWIKPNISTEDESWNEIAEAVESAREEGSLDDDEYRIMKNIMRFSEVLVSDVMTPRTVIFSCNADSTVEETVVLPEMRMYSRFPIWEGESLDDGIMGYVMSKDILHSALQGSKELSLRSFRRDVYYIPENARLDTALDMFLNRRQHLFVVVDEYGGVEGLLTMEDVLETMLGVEIVDEADRFVDMRLLAKQRRDRRISTVSSDGNE